MRRAHIGDNSYVDPTVQVYGWKQVRIGRCTVLCEEILINAMNRATDETTLCIGDHCFIGRNNYFNTGSVIRLGDYCLTANHCRFLGSGHDTRTPLVPYLAGRAVAEKDIIVGPNCWLGDGVVVLPGVTIGYGSIIGAATVVTKNVPPMSVVVGNPGRIVKRYSPEREQWVPLAEWRETEVLLEENAYVEILRKAFPNLRGALAGSSRLYGDHLG